MTQIYHVHLTDKDDPLRKRWDKVKADSRDEAREIATLLHPNCTVGVLTEEEYSICRD